MHYLLFTGLFIFLANKSASITIVKSIFLKRPELLGIEDDKNKAFASIIKDKAGLKNLKEIRIYDTDSFYGFMTGLPNMPIMAISKKAYVELNKDAMEWLLLHESAHHILRHSFKLAMMQISLAITGIIILMNTKSLFWTIVGIIFLALTFAIIAIQVAKRHEYEANTFAVKRMTNPKGMEDAALSLIKTYYRPTDYNTWYKRLYSQLFKVWGNSMHLKQIQQARKEISLRQK